MLVFQSGENLHSDILACDNRVVLYVRNDFRKNLCPTPSGLESIDPEDRDSNFLRKATTRCQTRRLQSSTNYISLHSSASTF
jgi:hypothetical protein